MSDYYGLDDLLKSPFESESKERKRKMGMIRSLFRSIHSIAMILVVLFVGWLGWLAVDMTGIVDPLLAKAGIVREDKPKALQRVGAGSGGGLEQVREGGGLQKSINPDSKMYFYVSQMFRYCAPSVIPVIGGMLGQSYDHHTCEIYIFSLTAHVSDKYPREVARFSDNSSIFPVNTQGPDPAGMPDPPGFYKVELGNISKIENGY